MIIRSILTSIRSYEPNRQELFQGPGWIEEGSILMTIEVIPGTTCDPPMFIDNPNIYRVFMWNIIDKYDFHACNLCKESD